MKLFTPDMNDRELDDLFRDAAAKASTPARREEVWAKLAEKLDTPKRSHRRKWGFLLIPLFVALGLVTWQLYPDHAGRQSSPIGSSEAVTGAQDSNTSLRENRRSAPGGEKSTVAGTGTDDEAPKPLDAAGKQAVPINFHLRDLTVKDPVSAGAVRKDVTPLPLLFKLPPDIRIRSVAPLSRAVISVSAPPAFKTETPAQPGDVRPALTLTPDVASVAKRGNPLKRPVHWTIGITAGPDWSSVAAKGWGTGVGGGLKLGYRLNAKWALETGVLLDKKIYQARPNDYNPPDNNWRNYDVQHINANCAVIDVPLNVEYTLWNNQDHRILLSTGLSSFWMHEEEYTYHYKTTTGNQAQWSKEMYGKHHHLFSILNFSAGYEKSWKNISFEAAPYVKVPLGGIGYGRVKLLSTGVHFTLKYGLK